VVLDVKGEAFRATAGYRKDMGQEVYLFDPASETGRSHRWDPFAAVQRNSVSRFRQIARQANLLFPEIDQIGGSANNNAFWDSAGRQAFSAVATIIAETPAEPLTMENVAQLFARTDGHEWLAQRVEAQRRTGQPYSKIAVDGISDYIGSNPKLRNDITKTVSVKLQTWYDPQIAAVTSVSDFDLRDLRRKPMTIYVVVAPGNIPRMRPLLRLFWDACVNLNTDTTPEEDPTLTVQTLFMMDEFARLGRMDTLAHATQFVRAYGIRLAFVVQNKAQLRAIYGRDGAADLFDNLGAEIVFGTSDPDLTKELEERLGDATVTITTRNRPRFMAWLNWSKQGESDYPHRRPLMLDQEVRMLDPDEQLIIRPGMLPAKTKRICWYRDPQFASLRQAPPEIPELRIEVASASTAAPPRKPTETRSAKPPPRRAPALSPRLGT
jgi:type IV secretion system protein VirD4